MGAGVIIRGNTKARDGIRCSKFGEDWVVPEVLRDFLMEEGPVHEHKHPR
jgi:hypothetical protein